MQFDAQVGDRGLVIDCTTGQVIPNAVRCDEKAGWYEVYATNPDTGAPLSRDDGMGYLTKRIRARIRFLRSPRPGSEEPSPLSERFWELQQRAGYVRQEEEAA